MLRRYFNYLINLFRDVMLVPFVSVVACFFAHATFGSFAINSEEFWFATTTMFLVQALCFWAFSVYRGFWRYASIQDCIKIIKSVALSSVLVFVILFLLHNQISDVGYFVIYFILQSSLLCSLRLFYRYAKESRQKITQQKRVLLVGAGQGAELLLRDLKNDPQHRFHIKLIVDDALGKQGKEMHGIRIAGRINDIPYLVSQHEIEAIFIAIPSASSTLMQRIHKVCRMTALPVKTLPGLNQLLDQSMIADQLRDVSIDDLLGRDPVELDWQGIDDSLKSKSILVTGGGGSIGSELCRQLLKFGLSQLVVVDHSEFNLYQLSQSLSSEYPHANVSYQLLSITNEPHLEKVFEQFKPQVVFHAAAYKHVPILEDQIAAAVFNNISGTKGLVDLAAKYQVDKFVLISTDKAVNPTNVMGSTKRIAEIYTQNYQNSHTKFITVRFGNVLGSAGSVIPLFKQQIANGGPITITHPNVKRYFMTIPEASQLIIQAFSMGNGGEIFILEMGELIKIKDLAEQLLLLAGKGLKSDIHIQYIGLRPGEKMIEELFHSGEEISETAHQKIMQGYSRQFDSSKINAVISNIIAHRFDKQRVLSEIRELVPEYQDDVSESIAC